MCVRATAHSVDPRHLIRSLSNRKKNRYIFGEESKRYHIISMNEEVAGVVPAPGDGKGDGVRDLLQSISEAETELERVGRMIFAFPHELMILHVSRI